MDAGQRCKNLIEIISAVRDVWNKMVTFEDKRQLQLSCGRFLHRHGFELNSIMNDQNLSDFLE